MKIFPTVINELKKIYTELDAEINSLLKENMADCLGCGNCCTFPEGAPILFASLLERTYMLMAPKVVNNTQLNACPFYNLHTNHCMAREFRAIGCRTHFCEDALKSKSARDHAEELCEAALAQVAALSEKSGIDWQYTRVVSALRHALDSDSNCVPPSE